MIRTVIKTAVFLVLCGALAGPARAETSKYQGRPISVELQDASVQSVFRMFSDVSRYNIVLHPEVSGKVTLQLKGVPWDQAMEIVLRMHNLYALTEGNVILVVPVHKVAEVYSSGLVH